MFCYFVYYWRNKYGQNKGTKQTTIRCTQNFIIIQSLKLFFKLIYIIKLNINIVFSFNIILDSVIFLRSFVLSVGGLSGQGAIGDLLQLTLSSVDYINIAFDFLSHERDIVHSCVAAHFHVIRIVVHEVIRAGYDSSFSLVPYVSLELVVQVYALLLKRSGFLRNLSNHLHGICNSCNAIYTGTLLHC